MWHIPCFQINLGVWHELNRVSDSYICWLENRLRVTSTKYMFQNEQKPEIRFWQKPEL
jgi:hypothetical protein